MEGRGGAYFGKETKGHFRCILWCLCVAKHEVVREKMV